MFLGFILNKITSHISDVDFSSQLEDVAFVVIRHI